MLILTRRAGESIKISDNITVVVLGIKGSQVRLGIEAPQGVSVDRQGIAERKAAGLPAPTGVTGGAARQESEPLHANRTEAEWRELLAQEQAAQAQEVNHGL